MDDTAATSSETSFVEKFKNYVTTRKGVILIAEMVLCLLVIICHAASIYVAYSTVAIVEMILSFLFFSIFMLELEKKFLSVSWIWSDFFRAITGAAVLTIVSLVNLIKWRGDGAWTAGGVFGLIAGVLFAYDTYTIYLQIQSSRQNTAAGSDVKV